MATLTAPRIDLTPRVGTDGSTPPRFLTGPPPEATNLEEAAQDYLDAARALKRTDQELDDATAALEACQRAADAAANRAQATEARLARYARPARP